MKLKLNKEALVTLSDDAEVLSEGMTPQIGGGHHDCETHHNDACNDGGTPTQGPEPYCALTNWPGETCGQWTCPPIN
jgi:hypothetical protein